MKMKNQLQEKKKEKIIIQIKNTNIKKKKEKFIIQIKNDKRKKNSTSTPNSASINSDVQSDFDSNKKISSPKKEKKIHVLSLPPEREKSKEEKKNNEDNKNDNSKEVNIKNKKKHGESKKDISVESKKEAILKIINNSATSNNPENQEEIKKNNSSSSKQQDKRNVENEALLSNPTKKDSPNKNGEIEHEKQKPRGRPPKSGKKKIKKESIESKTTDENKDNSKINDNNDNNETEKTTITEQKETTSNVNSMSTVDNSNKILQDKEIRAEPETEVKKHRGRPKKGRSSSSVHYINPRSHSVISQRRHEEEEMTEEMILEEEVSDPKGDEKVDIDGVLKDGRKYNVRTFILPHRSPTRIYMFTLDAAKQIGYKDSYLFLTKYPGVKRLWTNDEDRNYLCDKGILNNLLRNRSSGICTARNIFQQLGHEIIFNGRPIEDDYYVSNPNHNEEYHIHTNHDDTNSGMETDDTKDDEMSLRSQTPLYMGSPLVNSHYTQGSGHTHHPSHSHNHHGHHKSTTSVTNLLSAKEYFLQTLYQSAAEYNIAIQKSRKDSFYDIHTKINQVAQRIDMVEPTLEIKKENSSNVSIPSKKEYNLHFYSDDYSNTYQPTNHKSTKSQWEIINKEDYTQYPFALMDGQYQGLFSIYPRFKPNDKIQNLEDEYISTNTGNHITDIKPNVPEFIGNVHGDYIANPYFQKFRMSPSPSTTKGRHSHRFRSHHDSLNDTSSIASTPTLKSVPLEDVRKKRRGRPPRRGRPKRESFETYYDNEEENDDEYNNMALDQKKSSTNEDEIVDIINNDENENNIISPLNENVCVHCQSVDPPKHLYEKIDPSIQPRNMVIKCSVCDRNQHPCCCDIYDPYMISKILSYPWQCNDCKLCLKCNKAGDESKLLFCDLCDRGYHTYCLVPKLEKLPKGLWVCQQCAICASCHSNKPNKELNNNMITRRSINQPSTDWKHAVTYINKDTNEEEEVTIDIEDENAHDNRRQIYIATFCNSCYEHFQSKRFCPICFRCYKEHDSDISMICCDNCDRWIDVDCDSDLDDEKYQSLCEHSDAKYLCPFCDPTKLQKLKKKILSSNRRIVKYKGYGIIVPPFFVPRNQTT